VTQTLVKATRRHRRAGLIAFLLVALYALAGFAFLPWLIPRLAGDLVSETYGAELRFGNVAVNPFVLSLRIDDLELDDPQGNPVAAVSQIYVNFQSSSLFRLAWTFDEIRVDSPRLTLRRAADGRLNAAFLAGTDDPVASSEREAEAGGGLPKLLVFDFAITGSVVDWDDRVPPVPVVTRLGPVNIRIAQLNTLPDRSGEQSVVIATETQGTLSWSGSLQLNPVRSTGRAAVEGSHFPLLSAYLRHEVGFEIVEGDADLEFAYDVGVRNDGSFEAGIDDFGVRFSGVRIRPFLPDTPGASADVLRIPELVIEGGVFQYPEQTVSIGSFEILDPELMLNRDPGGNLNVLPAGDVSAGTGTAADPQPTSMTDPPAAANSRPWQLSLDRFLIDRASVSFTDDSIAPAAELGVSNLRLAVSEISNTAAAEFPVEFSTDLASGGRIGASGRLTVLPELVLSFDVGVERLALDVVQPYLQGVADVSLDSGELGLSGAIRHAPDNLLSFSGDAEIADLVVTETDEGSRLGSWTRFGIEGIALELAQDSLSVDRLELIEPYVDVLIAEDGSVNLGRAGKDQPTAESFGEPSGESSGDSSAPFEVAIGGVDIANASARFTDLALPLPFEAEIAELNGSLSTIATSSSEPATVDLEGTVDSYGRFRMTGSVTPLEPARNTDLRVTFENVEMPKVSAYTIPFAGRAIADGRLDLDLGYRIEEGALVGENSFVLRNFELGDRVPHPGAASLPLGLAVALLKDVDGNIDVDVPVRGDINDPEFSYGGAVRRAITNLIVRIAASPFALLGNLLGVEADELEYLYFDPGESALAPPERERISKLAEALTVRPELVLELPPATDTEADRAALQAEELERRIAERLAAPEAADAGVAERRMTVLEALYVESAGSAESEDALAALRAEFTRPADGDESGAALDALAYAAALERRLADRMALPDGMLASLAESRAETVRAALIDIDMALDARIVITGAAEASRGPEGRVRMRVALAAGAATP